MKTLLSKWLLLFSLTPVFASANDSEIAVSLGGQGRFIFSHSSDKDIESHKRGYFASGNMALHWLSQDVIYHLAGSWGFFELEGDEATGSLPPRNRKYFNGRLASAELGFQVNTSENFYFGPQATVLFGQNPSLSPDPDSIDNLPRVLFGFTGTQKFSSTDNHLL